MRPHASAHEKTSLQLRVRGLVYLPGDSAYDQEAAAFNLATRHTPDLVLAAADADDVAAAVHWAAERGMSISVQATGHGAANAITDGLLVSTRRLLDLDIDPEERTARVGAGIRWREVVAAAAPYGLMGLHGSATDVGVVGYTVGGGLPLLGRKYGFASDHVLAIEVVTPDGVQHRVDQHNNPRLFALLRGGKGNFGIVTAMEFRLFPAGELYAGGIFYPGERAREVLTAFREWAPALPTDASASLAFLRLPELEDIPELLRGRFVMHLRFAWQGTAAEGQRLLDPMRGVAPVLADLTGPLPFTQVDAVHLDPENPVPVREGGMLLNELDEALAEALLEVAGPDSNAPLLLAEVRLMGGALAAPAAPSSHDDHVAGRDAAWSFFAVGVMMPESADLVPAAIAAARRTLAPFGTGGTAVNMHGHVESAAEAAKAWPEGSRRRLSEAKAELDPQNLFRHGHAIVPAVPGPAPAF
ncbi:FAD/FMN-containing dehydrogenase [Arthrobacter sp. ok909]|uniref:FAD-binding oxidoreductase n=1 Tax=Arthrobacter sp. ok909 TaxID=1761746 RepID=UPI0008828C7D|nr:FAD-binding oxidoreductase [Arthrobacter sp. ok909]SDP13272.1 FAD/FMN-containing dehydrogenase [Arthrobacter sp. ok909]